MRKWGPLKSHRFYIGTYKQTHINIHPPSNATQWCILFIIEKSQLATLAYGRCQNELFVKAVEQFIQIQQSQCCVYREYGMFYMFISYNIHEVEWLYNHLMQINQHSCGKSVKALSHNMLTRGLCYVFNFKGTLCDPAIRCAVEFAQSKPHTIILNHIGAADWLRTATAVRQYTYFMRK